MQKHTCPEDGTHCESLNREGKKRVPRDVNISTEVEIPMEAIGLTPPHDAFSGDREVVICLGTPKVFGRNLNRPNGCATDAMILGNQFKWNFTEI